MKQYYTNSKGGVSCFTDAKENYRSIKAKAEDIKVLSGDATAEQIADDINYTKVRITGRAVGWRK